MLGIRCVESLVAILRHAPFTLPGTFLARISRNRTVREVINYSLCAPLLYAFLWFAVFGGAGIKMHRAAIEQEAQATLLGVVEQIKVCWDWGD